MDTDLKSLAPAYGVPVPSQSQSAAECSVIGLWVTSDGHIRHELMPNGRYVEARGTRESAYTGRYWLDGQHIDYLDDTGFTADCNFHDDVLHHAGMVLFRRPRF